MARLICDTGVLYAAIDADDADHSVCRRLLSGPQDRLLVPAPVIVELDWLLSSRVGHSAVDALLADIESGALEVVELTPADYSRVRDLAQQYVDLRLGLVDASVVAVAERLDCPDIATLDRRHFSVIRPASGGQFRLLPE